MTSPRRHRRPGARIRSDEWRARVSIGVKRGIAHRRARLAAEARIGAEELRAFADAGLVTARLHPLLEAELRAGAEVLQAVAVDPSPQQRMLVADLTRLGVVLRGELAKYVSTQDADSAVRITSTINARRQLLVTLGLTRAARDVEPDLRSYLAARSGNGAGREIDAEAVHEDAPEGAAPAEVGYDAGDSGGRV